MKQPPSDIIMETRRLIEESRLLRAESQRRRILRAIERELKVSAEEARRLLREGDDGLT